MLDGNGATIIWSDMAWHAGSHCMPEGLVGVLDVGLGVPGDTQVVQSFLCQDGDTIMYMRRVRAVPLNGVGIEGLPVEPGLRVSGVRGRGTWAAFVPVHLA